MGEQLWDRFTVHYTPVHGSWLNQAEIEISVLAGQCLGKRRMGSIESCGVKCEPGIVAPIAPRRQSTGNSTGERLVGSSNTGYLSSGQEPRWCRRGVAVAVAVADLSPSSGDRQRSRSTHTVGECAPPSP